MEESGSTGVHPARSCSSTSLYGLRYERARAIGWWGADFTNGLTWEKKALLSLFSPRSRETQLLVHRALGNAETSSVLGRAGAQCQGSCWAWIHGVPGCPACLAPLLWALPHSAALGEPLKHSFYKIRWVWEVSVISSLLKPVVWHQRSVSADIRCGTSKVTEGLRLRSPAGLRNIWTEQRFPPPGMWVMWCCCDVILLWCDAAVVRCCCCVLLLWCHTADLCHGSTHKARTAQTSGTSQKGFSQTWHGLVLPPSLPEATLPGLPCELS